MGGVSVLERLALLGLQVVVLIELGSIKWLRMALAKG
jgi:hypothetical protein